MKIRAVEENLGGKARFEWSNTDLGQHNEGGEHEEKKKN